MKHNVEPRELDGYALYLQGHLRDHHFPQRNNSRFITQRAEEAYDCFVTQRLQGKSVYIAEEMAMRTLLKGLFVSRYDIIYNILEEELWLRLPDETWPMMAEHLLGLPQVKSILDCYELDGDFLQRETHQPMLTELLGTITEILDGYGL